MKATDKDCMVDRYDPLVRRIGEKKLRQDMTKKSYSDHGQNKSSRELGRLRLKHRKLSGQEYADLAEFIAPKHFNNVIQATKYVQVSLTMDTLMLQVLQYTLATVRNWLPTFMRQKALNWKMIPGRRKPNLLEAS